VPGPELEAFFAGRPEARALFDELSALVDALGPHEVRVTKSQVAFARRRQFAWAWTPDRYLRGGVAPLVLSIALERRDPSSRWKQIVEPMPGRWMHHLDLRSTDDLDGEVLAWLREAYGAAI